MFDLHLSETKEYDLAVIGGGIAGTAAAISAARAGARVILVERGGSLGGGMGAMCIPWDKRIHYGDLDVPTLGGRIVLNYPCPPQTPGETRRQKALESEEGMRIIDFCNASAAAQFIRVPTLITPALSDPSVPPPGQFAVANSIPEEFRIMRIKEAGHAAPTEADKAMATELAEIREKLFVPRS